MKKGVVFEIKDKNTVVVMTPDFDFTEVKTSRKLEIGDEIEIGTVIRWDRIIKCTSVAACILILFTTANLQHDKPIQVATEKKVEKPVNKPPAPAPTPEPVIAKQEPAKEKKLTDLKLKKKIQVAKSNKTYQKKTEQPIMEKEDTNKAVPPQPNQTPQRTRQIPQPEETPQPKQTPQPEQPQEPKQTPQPSPAPEQPKEPSNPVIKVPTIDIQIGVQTIDAPQKTYVEPYLKWLMMYNEWINKEYFLNRRGERKHYIKEREETDAQRGSCTYERSLQ